MTALVVAALGAACGDDEAGDDEADAVGAEVSDDDADVAPDEDGAQLVSRAEFEADGRTWPLTIDDAVVECERKAAILRTPEGEEFSLNGVALSRGFADISDSDIIVPGEVEGTHMSTGDLTAAALEVCA